MFDLFKNHQKWLINSIPNKKTDIPDLIRDVLYKMVIHFVEDDKGLENNIWDEDEGHKELNEKIINIYNWITEERPLMVDKLSQLWDTYPDVPAEVDIQKFIRENNLQSIMDFQEKLWDMDQSRLKEIVELRDYLVVV